MELHPWTPLVIPMVQITLPNIGYASALDWGNCRLHMASNNHNH